jgi:hypothetical protein
MNAGKPPPFDAHKFKEAIIYICQRSDQDQAFGSVKLNKILFYADFRAYTQGGAPITGATYRHLAEGPAPKEMLPARAELETEGALRVELRNYFNRQQKRPVALRPADLSRFSGQDVATLDAAIDYLSGKDAAEASAVAHREWGWKLTDENEDIPYALAWLSPDPLTEEQVVVGEQLAQEMQS